MMSSEKVCPRCGQPYSYIEKQRKGDREYYVAVHYLGYERTSNGKIKKKVRKCYLGPINYEYVTRLHNFTLHGYLVLDRELKYLEKIVQEIEELRRNQEKMIERLDKIVNLLEYFHRNFMEKRR